MLKNNYHWEGYCVCCMNYNYKGKEVEGCELKFNRLITADKKHRKVRWPPLGETGQKSDSMFATIIRTALFKKHTLFSLLYFGQNSFNIQMLLKTGVGVYI